MVGHQMTDGQTMVGRKVIGRRTRVGQRANALMFHEPTGVRQDGRHEVLWEVRRDVREAIRLEVLWAVLVA